MQININEIKPGSMVKIKKGTEIRTTKAPYNTIARRDYVIKVHSVDAPSMVTVQSAMSDPKYLDLAVKHGASLEEMQALKATNSLEYYTKLIPLGDTMITWVGSGGYWQRVSVKDVELLPENV